MTLRARLGGPAAATATDAIPADALAPAALSLAKRFSAGATMWCVAPEWPAHGRHVAVEFVHPVVVGKRALPAVAVDAPDVAAVLHASIRAGDVLVVIATADEPLVLDLARRAEAWGVETFWIGAGDRPEEGAAGHVLWLDDLGPLAAYSGRLIGTYHVLWEMTHVCFEHPGLLSPKDDGGARAGSVSPEATDFLYPFIDGGERDAESLLADLRASAAAKGAESSRLRDATVAARGPDLDTIAGELAARSAEGGVVFTFGNGGSATDAQSVAGLFAHPPVGVPVAARCLSDDAAVLTALSNDVGFDLVFSRQLIAHGRVGDTALGISTSGDSSNLLHAFREAKRLGLLTVALIGAGGGQCATSDDVDHCLVVHSDSVHRTQETQAELALELWARVQRSLGVT